MTTKSFDLTEEQRHALASLVAHTLGFDCLDGFFSELHDEFRKGRLCPKPWLEIKIVRRVYDLRQDAEFAVLGKVQRDMEGAPKYDYVLSCLPKKLPKALK
jgi:hypothetical protein